MASIYEIAREAGVSATTVARALSGKGYCSPDKRKQILALAKKMNYSPSHAARSLKSNITNKVLFCIPDIYNPFYFRMIQGVSEVLEGHGYLPLLCPTKGDLKTELKMLQNLREGYGDGMVFVSFNFTPENISIVNSCSRPVVLTNNYPENKGDQFDSVYIDTFEGIAMACRHFIAQGIRDIGYIGGVPSAQTGRERQNGYISALEKAGIPLTPDWIQEGDFSRASGEEAMRRLSGLDKLPEAIVVANDLMAIGALQVCRELNIRVPEDLAIIGMDDIDSAQLLGLSSIQMLEDEIGRNAAELLMDRIINGSRPRKTIRLLPKLSIRASSEKVNA